MTDLIAYSNLVSVSLVAQLLLVSELTLHSYWAELNGHWTELSWKMTVLMLAYSRFTVACTL